MTAHRRAREHRSDVQGLRALAVVVVIAAHAGVPFLPGGFVGVDVFFVISGFLITGLLVREAERTGPDLAGRLLVPPGPAHPARGDPRARRDAARGPGLAAADHRPRPRRRRRVVRPLRRQPALRRRGRVVLRRGQRPLALQHYWSLAVEEQFYVVWPLVHAGAGGLSRAARLLLVLLAVTGASFAWSLVATAADPAAAYFSTPARVWELGVGAVLALVLPRLAPRVPRPASWLLGAGGLAAIVLACVVLSPRHRVPRVRRPAAGPRRRRAPGRGQPPRRVTRGPSAGC